ncbi:hypothetical protein AB832_05020 [Flavobacteriaceae bacterium (ex Bugula neritina AB1)]|nr:hypothetical protein AB832_05020 [Flavobacteriaceae bacterium (ex Bugula neritina AB1)]
MILERKKPFPPYSKGLRVGSEISLIVICVGKNGWSDVKSMKRQGLHNGIVLECIDDHNKYIWPVNSCYVSVIDYECSSHENVKSFCYLLGLSGAKQVIYRPYPDKTVITYDFMGKVQ